MQEDPPVLDRLGEIAVPTSLLVGDLDYPPLIESNRQAAARIPGCQLPQKTRPRQLPGTGSHPSRHAGGTARYNPHPLTSPQPHFPHPDRDPAGLGSRFWSEPARGHLAGGGR
jgi:hypothetical protein